MLVNKNTLFLVLTIFSLEWYNYTMKKLTIYSIITLVLLSGCTQLITAPISLAGTAVSTTIDVAGSTVGAVTPD